MFLDFLAERPATSREGPAQDLGLEMSGGFPEAVMDKSITVAMSPPGTTKASGSLSSPLNSSSPRRKPRSSPEIFKDLLLSTPNKNADRDGDRDYWFSFPTEPSYLGNGRVFTNDPSTALAAHDKIIAAGTQSGRNQTKSFSPSRPSSAKGSTCPGRSLIKSVVFKGGRVRVAALSALS